MNTYTCTHVHRLIYTDMHSHTHTVHGSKPTAGQCAGGEQQVTSVSLVVHLSALSVFSWAAERQIRGGRLGLGGPLSPDVVEDQLLGGRLNTCGPMDVPVVHRVVEQQLLVL